MFEGRANWHAYAHVGSVWRVYIHMGNVWRVYIHMGSLSWHVCIHMERIHIWECMACIRTFGEFVVARMHTYGEATYVGLAKTIYIRCIYGIFGREITKYTVIYGVYKRFWPTLQIRCLQLSF